MKQGNITRASFNLSEQDHDEYYNRFSNAVLWPAFHYRLDLVDFQREAWEGYQRVNATLADKLLPLIEPDDIVWIHDYHLLPLASELRQRGVNNRIGFFYIFRSRRRKSLTRSRRTRSCLNSCAITIYWVSRPRAIAWRFSIAYRCRLA